MNTTVILLIGIMLGLLLYAISQNKVRRGITLFRNRAPIIKKYWLYIVPFVVLTTVAYVVMWRYFYDPIHFEVLNQATSLALAIFVGYIAFSEYGEGKFDKLVESAQESLARHEFNTAKLRLKEAHAIKPKDNAVTADLLELYLILRLEDDFDVLIEAYGNNFIEESDQLIHQYLLTLKPLLNEHMREGKAQIIKLIQLVNDNPNIRERFHWNNETLLASDTFRLLSSENSRKILTNLYAYLNRQLNNDQEKSFVEGKYDNIGPA